MRDRKIAVLSGLVFGVGLLFVACTPRRDAGTGRNDASDAATARESIEAQGRRWQDAVTGEDAAAVAEVYATDAVFLPPGAPAVSGRDTIRGMYEAMFGAMDATYEFTVERLDVAGDRAWRWGHYEAAAALPSGDTLRADDKFVDVWRRERDGTWRIVADIWNANQPPAGSTGGGG
jgi:uncharacterized protein (TIGR02246 family)